MKRVVFLLGIALLLIGCSHNEVVSKIDNSDNESQTNEPEDYEVLFERDHEILLFDDDNLEIKLLRSKHERDSVQDWMKLELELTNKTDRTLEYYFSEIKLDSKTYDDFRITVTDTEVNASEELNLIMAIDSYDPIEFEEYIGGELTYRDYAGETREKAIFDKYINE